MARSDSGILRCDSPAMFESSQKWQHDFHEKSCTSHDCGAMPFLSPPSGTYYGDARAQLGAHARGHLAGCPHFFRVISGSGTAERQKRTTHGQTTRPTTSVERSTQGQSGGESTLPTHRPAGFSARSIQHTTDRPSSAGGAMALC
jgi:hypothetical protein